MKQRKHSLQTHSRTFLCLFFTAWPFPSAKPLGPEGTINKGCISSIPTARRALTLFTDSLWDRGLLPSQGKHMGSCFKLMPLGPITFRDSRHSLTPEKKYIHSYHSTSPTPLFPTSLATSHTQSIQSKGRCWLCELTFKNMATVAVLTT